MFKALLFLISIFFSIHVFAADDIAIENMLNTERVDRQLAPLTIDAQLQCAAKNQATFMGDNNYCSHRGKKANSLKDRLKECGFDLGVGEEIIACKYQAPSPVIKAWIDTPKTKAFMLNKSFTKLGCADYKNYYVCVLTR